MLLRVTTSQATLSSQRPPSLLEGPRASGVHHIIFSIKLKTWNGRERFVDGRVKFVFIQPRMTITLSHQAVKGIYSVTSFSPVATISCIVGSVCVCLKSIIKLYINVPLS